MKNKEKDAVPRPIVDSCTRQVLAGGKWYPCHYWNARPTIPSRAAPRIAIKKLDQQDMDFFRHWWMLAKENTTTSAYKRDLDTREVYSPGRELRFLTVGAFPVSIQHNPPKVELIYDREKRLEPEPFPPITEEQSLFLYPVEKEGMTDKDKLKALEESPTTTPCGASGYLKSELYLCSLPAGHKGEHEAHGPDDHLYHEWRT